MFALLHTTLSVMSDFRRNVGWTSTWKEEPRGQARAIRKLYQFWTGFCQNYEPMTFRHICLYSCPQIVIHVNMSAIKNSLQGNVSLNCVNAQRKVNIDLWFVLNKTLGSVLLLLSPLRFIFLHEIWLHSFYNTRVRHRVFIHLSMLNVDDWT